MLVFPILAKMMENAYKHVMADLPVFVRTDTRVKIANFVSKSNMFSYTSFQFTRIITMIVNLMIVFFIHVFASLCFLYGFKNGSGFLMCKLNNNQT